jgi:hypothetical protein
LQISIRELDGTVIYASFAGIADGRDEEEFAQAASGTVVASLQDLEIAAVIVNRARTMGDFGSGRR